MDTPTKNPKVARVCVLVKPEELRRAMELFHPTRYMVVTDGGALVGNRIDLVIRTTMQNPDSEWERLVLGSRLMPGAVSVRVSSIEYVSKVVAAGLVSE